MPGFFTRQHVYNSMPGEVGLQRVYNAAAKHAAATARPTLSKEELRTKVVAVAMAPMAPVVAPVVAPTVAPTVAPAVAPAAPVDPVVAPVVAPFDVALFDEDVNDVDGAVNDIDIDMIVHSLADALGDGEIDTTLLDYDTRGLDPLTVQCPSRHHTPPTHLR